jgi:hypothetical protein
MSGAGKSWFARKYMINIEPTCRFLFDESSRFSEWLPVRPCFTWEDCCKALPSRWVLFNPLQLYPDNYAKAFDDFCHWVYEASGGGPGAKVLAVQELWQWCDTRTIPRGLQLCCQAGRARGVQLLLDTHSPQKVNSSIIEQTTELISFRLQAPKAWDCIDELGMDVEKIKNLPLGQFISLNRLSGGTITGRMF